jgi:arylsulfatase A-like enzyme
MISLVDVMATAAAIVDADLPPATIGAEDSCSFLPVLLGDGSTGPKRGDMILHSNDGVFAIRQGQWKWIEGIPAKGIDPPRLKAHAPEFRSQLYNLHEDPLEAKDVSAEHPEVVKQMEALLRKQRDAGHTRDL